MPTSRRRRKQPQAYDTTLKKWVQDQPTAILPQLLPGVSYKETLNVEIIRPALRVDKAFKVLYHGQDHVLHIEFESGTDNRMESRLLTYHAILHREYYVPVISIIVYPFRVKTAVSPWHEMSGDEALVTFRFRVLPLFALEAERFVREHVACMYPLLPTMQGANHELIKRAMDELAALYKDDEVTLSQQFVWMQSLLERTDTIAELEKDEIRRQLAMYDPLWEENPRVLRDRAASKLEGLQDALIAVIEARFPSLTELARQQVRQIKHIDLLNLMIKKASITTDENMVRWLLLPPTA